LRNLNSAGKETSQENTEELSETYGAECPGDRAKCPQPVVYRHMGMNRAHHYRADSSMKKIQHMKMNSLQLSKGTRLVRQKKKRFVQ
jgi:hypothetical protein